MTSCNRLMVALATILTLSPFAPPTFAQDSPAPVPAEVPAEVPVAKPPITQTAGTRSAVPIVATPATPAGGNRWGALLSIGPDTIPDLVAAVEPCIVNISCARAGVKPTRAISPEEINKRKKYFGDAPGEDTNYLKLSGSGVIVRPDGYILTSLHVVQNQSNITVTLSDGKTYAAKIINRDSFYDLAVLKIEATGLPVARFADMSQIRKGDFVIAIGNQMGLENSVTSGLVSGIAREVKGYTAYGAKTGAVRFIQTDTAVNPGSSGGPLLNLKGEVVGINTFIRDDAQNVGFAIPANIAQEVANKLASTGLISHPYIGIEMVDPADQVNTSGIPQEGIQISTVKPGGPAQSGGLLANDVILSIEDRTVSKPDDVSQAVARASIGSILKFKVRRGGSVKLLDVKVAALPDSESE